MIEADKRLARRYLEEVVNTGNVDRVVNGRIVEHGGAANLLEPLLASGAIRMVGPAQIMPARADRGSRSEDDPTINACDSRETEMINFPMNPTSLFSLLILVQHSPRDAAMAPVPRTERLRLRRGRASADSLRPGYESALENVAAARPLLALAFSPDGTRLATASVHRTIKVWSLPTGQELITLTGYQLNLSAVVFSPDGSTLISSTADGEVRSWRAATAAQIAAGFP